MTYVIRGSADLSDKGGRHPALLTIQLQAQGQISWLRESSAHYLEEVLTSPTRNPSFS